MYKDFALPLFNNGYQPIPIKPGTKRPDYNNWQTEEGEAAVQQHIRTKPDYGIGFNNVNALDFDIRDPEIAHLMEQLMYEMFPDAPIRVGAAPKFLGPIHSNSDVSKKVKATWMNGGQKNEIEILHKGQQQFVAYATHPDTGLPYTWINKSPFDVPADDLPLFGADKITALLNRFDVECEARGFTKPTSGDSGPQAPQGTAEEQKLWSELPDHVKGAQPINPFPQIPETIPLDILEQCVNLLPQHYCDDRDCWFKLGGIIYDVTEGSDEGFRIFDTWSRKSSKYNLTPMDTTSLKWRGYKTKEGNAGLGTLFHWLEQAGTPIPTAQEQPGPAPTGPDSEPFKAGDAPPPPETDLSMSFDIARDNFMYLKETDELADLRDMTVTKYNNTKKALGKYDRLAPGKSASKSFLDTWRRDPKAVVVRREWFRPVKNTPIIYEEGLQYFNSYNPPSIPKVDKWDPAIIKPVLDHIRYIMPEEVIFEAFLDWTAAKWRDPRFKAYAFLIITSSQQTGKGVLLALLKAMFGNSRVVPSDSTTFSSKAGAFNEFLDGSLINFCDEAKFDRAAYDKLKAWVYEPYLHVNKKNGFKGTMETFSNWLIFSNHLDSAVITKEDKRLAVSIMRDVRKSSAYYTDLFNRITDPDKVLVSHFVAMLEARDISNFKRHEPPWSDAKDSMVEASKDDVNFIIEQMIDDGVGPCKYDITSAALVFYYIQAFEEEVKTSRREVSMILERLTTRRQLQGYTVRVKPKDMHSGPLINSRRQKGLLCLRHFDTIRCWKDADNAELKLEYLRSREAAVNPSTSRGDINKMPSYEMKEA